MKRIAILLLTLSTFTAQFLFAQDCPTKASYTNQSGTFDLSSKTNIILNDGKFYQITVQNNFSSTSSICVLNGSSVMLMFQNVNSMAKGGFINVDKTSTLTIGGSGINNFPLTINNYGITTQATSITYADGATINNTGTYTISSAATLNSGAITFTNSGTMSLSAGLNYNNGTFSMINAANSSISFSAGLTLSNTSIRNYGTINCSSNVTLQGSSYITNNNVINISGDLSFSGATFANNGVLFISGSTTVNTGSTFNNACTIKCSSYLTNNGTMSNTGNIILGGAFTNQNSFTNGTAGFVQGSNFTNNSTISGGGNFYFSGTTLNQGPFTGGDTKINFYDVSNTSGKYFDIQNTTPTNTTKNQISPNTSASFTSCSDVAIPVISLQPSVQYLCGASVTTAKFGITATSNTTPKYQWYKNGTAISQATGSTLSLSGLSLADTASTYYVTVTNTVGTITSSSTSIKYIITSQPASLYLATGNAASFSIKTSGATAWQWQKNGTNISGATTTSYALSVVNQSDSGSYKASVTYSGGVCTSDAATLKTSIVLYSNSNGKLTSPSTWGVATDGSGSTPVDFTREEHTFIVANRTKKAETGGKLTIAGTLDLADNNLSLTDGTLLTVGRIIRSVSGGVLSVSLKDSLTIQGISTAAYAGASDLYFDATNNTIQRLTINSSTVTLRTALNIANDNGTKANSNGVLTVAGGTFNTSDLLTLKSDKNGTGSIASSAGTISGKVTIEKYINNKRSWRLMGAPVSSVNAPTINASYQEGAKSSTDNPNPGYGTHITYGLESEGFDQNPQKSFSMKVRNSSGSWVGVPATNKTAVTDYPAYMLFIRGDRSYDILTTTNSKKATSTVLRVTGNVNQGTLATKTVAATGYTLVSNPYACPVNFTKLKSSNVKSRIRVWDPSLAGSKGVGGWVILDGTSGIYKATPSSNSVSTLLQAGQGFLVESADGKTSGSLIFGESAKDLTSVTTSADRVGEVEGDTSLAINLKLFNEDSTTAIADGVLFNFNARNNDSVDNNDAAKMSNFGENLSIKESSLLTISNRTMPKESDSLHLSLTNAKEASYQMEIIPSSLKEQSLSLYDKYLNTFAPISSTDTTRITFSINNAVAASGAADRFTIVAGKSKVKPVISKGGITSVKATANGKTINVEWNVSNESGIAYYEVQKSADGTAFSAAGTVAPTGAASYSFTDAKPASGISYYRVKSISKTGSVSYTGIVSAQLQPVSATAAASVGVYPNPLTGTAFTLTLNNLNAGAYTLSVVSSNGTAAFTKAVQHNGGGTASQKISLSHPLTGGIYYVKLTSAEGSVHTVKIIAR